MPDNISSVSDFVYKCTHVLCFFAQRPTDYGGTLPGDVRPKLTYSPSIISDI